MPPKLQFSVAAGELNRGAELSALSQYRAEAEVCFAPLLGLEVARDQIDAEGVRLITVRILPHSARARTY